MRCSPPTNRSRNKIAKTLQPTSGYTHAELLNAHCRGLIDAASTPQQSTGRCQRQIVHGDARHPSSFACTMITRATPREHKSSRSSTKPLANSNLAIAASSHITIGPHNAIRCLRTSRVTSIRTRHPTASSHTIAIVRTKPSCAAADVFPQSLHGHTPHRGTSVVAHCRPTRTSPTMLCNKAQAAVHTVHPHMRPQSLDAHRTDSATDDSAQVVPQPRQRQSRIHMHSVHNVAASHSRPLVTRCLRAGLRHRRRCPRHAKRSRALRHRVRSHHRATPSDEAPCGAQRAPHRPSTGCTVTHRGPDRVRSTRRPASASHGPSTGTTISATPRDPQCRHASHRRPPSSRSTTRRAIAVVACRIPRVATPIWCPLRHSARAIAAAARVRVPSHHVDAIACIHDTSAPLAR
jgi:hypothetical protein